MASKQTKLIIDCTQLACEVLGTSDWSYNGSKKLYLIEGRTFASYYEPIEPLSTMTIDQKEDIRKRLITMFSFVPTLLEGKECWLIRYNRWKGTRKWKECPQDHYLQNLERPVSPDCSGSDFHLFYRQLDEKEAYQDKMEAFLSRECGECCLGECEEHEELSSFQEKFNLPPFMSNGGDEDFRGFCGCPDPSVHSLYRYYGNRCGHKNIFQIGAVRLMEFCHS